MVRKGLDFGLITGRDTTELRESRKTDCINDFYAQWLILNRGLSQANVKHEVQRLNKLLRTYGEVNEQNASAIAARIMACDAANSTKRHYLFALEAWLAYLGFEMKFKKPRAGSRSPDYLSQDQLTILIKSSRDYREYAILATFIFTGARLNEVRMLNWQDIDLHTHKVVIHHAKLDKEREIPLAPELERVIMAFRARLPPNEIGSSQPVFKSIRGDRISNHALAGIVVKAGERCGIRVHPHAIRHSFATAWAANGGDVFHLKEILGHSDIHMTEKYWHVCGDSRREAFKRGAPKLIT